MTLLVRDEADVIDANLSFHLNAGVDFVLATDHRSRDGTTEILERCEREGYARVLREEREEYLDAEWRTRMARMAATEYAADWVFNADADEFWWPRSGSLKEVLGAVPARYGVVRGVWRHFVPRPSRDAFFADTMTVRTVAQRHRDRPFRPQIKVAHRAHPRVVVAGGSHDAFVPGLLHLRSWYPIEVLHFPVRSLEQCERKYRVASVVRAMDPAGLPQRPAVARAIEAYEGGVMSAFYDSLTVGDDSLREGLERGTLAIDTRLRDALARIRRETSEPLEFPTRDLADDAGLVEDIALVAEYDSPVRLEKRMRALEERLAALEVHGRPSGTVAAGLRSLRRRGRLFRRQLRP